VNHLEGHIYANFLAYQNPNNQIPITKQFPNPKSQNPKFPFVCLIVSGGHTLLVLVKDHGKYQTLGHTRDDAAGEAFDKVARFLNLGYPGGPIIDKLAKEGNPRAVDFTRPMLEGYDFSFSGIKTAVVNLILKTENRKPKTEDLVASFQQAVVDVLVEKTIRAAKEYGGLSIALAGGVAANSLLRNQLQEKAKDEKLKVFIPPLAYCTDNAAMIGAAAFFKYQRKDFSDFSLSPLASARI
jgi:N6-L-threonylcarbamoyladenine synthase